MNPFARHAADTSVDDPTRDLSDEVSVSPLSDVDLSEDPFADDLSEQLQAAAPRRWATRTTLILAGLVLLVGGFVAGAQVQKQWGGTGSSAATGTGNRGTGFPQAGASFPAGAFGGRGQGTGTTGGNSTTGTVKLVDGTTVYITTASGQTVIVKTDGSTTVETPGALSNLTAGSTVTVQGTTGSDGSVTASRITKTK
jgi:hypothetical protein